MVPVVLEDSVVVIVAVVLEDSVVVEVEDAVVADVLDVPEAVLIVVVCSLVVLLDIVVVCAVVVLVAVRVTIFISGGAISNEDSIISSPSDLNTACKDSVKLAESLTTAFVASKIRLEEYRSAVISNPTSHELEDDRDEAEATATDTWLSATS